MNSKPFPMHDGQYENKIYAHTSREFFILLKHYRKG